MPSLTFPMKGAASSSGSSINPTAPGSDRATTSPTGRPLKIGVVFDEDVSSRNAEKLIKYVVSDFEYNVQSFTFDELDPPGPGVTAAHSVSDADILVVAICEDRALPDHMQLWLGLCLGLREEG